jgi:hypothetical protein
MLEWLEREAQAMSKPSSKTFDCVQSMREIRDKISAEIAGMDPFLQRLAEKAAQQADTGDRLSVRG